MSKNQINKYVWLVETLYKAKKITLKEINRRWLDSDFSEGKEIPRRTFHTWKNEVEDIFGIIHDEDYEVETVVLRANATQANYLRSLPLHPSQKEMGCIDNYTIFTLQVRPTFDFQQKLLWNGDALEVLEPLWLRKEMAERTQRMCDIYKNKRK